MGLCRRIVDLVETGSTLLANGLVELATISDEFAAGVNRAAWKQRPEQLDSWIKRSGQRVTAVAE